MTQTIDTTTTVARYLEFWNADPGPDQQRLATEVFAPEVDYVAPIGASHGHDGLLALARELATHLGDVAFVARAEPDAHHDRARVRWEVIRGDDSFATGTDVLVLDEHGRIASVTAFLDRAPEGFDPQAHD
jgi:hypothetical protein